MGLLSNQYWKYINAQSRIWNVVLGFYTTTWVYSFYSFAFMICCWPSLLFPWFEVPGMQPPYFSYRVSSYSSSLLCTMGLKTALCLQGKDCITGCHRLCPAHLRRLWLVERNPWGWLPPERAFSAAQTEETPDTTIHPKSPKESGGMALESEFLNPNFAFPLSSHQN